ncbi:MAG: hypothetical protein U0572_15890 [Phycisphaerales bacterium]
MPTSAALLATLGIAAIAAADTFTDIGYTALIARLGAGNVPTGAGIGVGQVEAQETPGNFGPDTANADFVGTTFSPQSGAMGLSGHATTVGLAYYGNTSSVAPGVTDVFVWEAGAWATTGYLKTNQGATPPAFPPSGLRVFNHSWIGSFGGSFLDNDALRRLDFAIQRDNLMVLLGTNNGAGSPAYALLAYGYNGITVGLANGQHCNAITPAGLDGPNRRKPEIVAPASFTSFSTPIVSASSALLLGATDTDPMLALNPNADKSIVIKSVLLAGATHRSGWSNGAVTSGPNRGTTSTPLDPLYGADLLNVDRSHLILTGQEHDASASIPLAPTIDESGWDFIPSIGSNASVYYRFRIFEQVPEVSILATWNRSVATNFGSFNLMDIDLTLWKISGTALQPLIGEAGVSVFGAGNVSSTSTIDNVEHLYINNLVAGDYVIEVKRKTGSQTALPVAVAWYIPKTTKFGDLNDDDVVDAADLAILLGSWGNSGPADLNDDGTIDAADLAILLGEWG